MVLPEHRLMTSHRNWSSLMDDVDA